MKDFMLIFIGQEYSDMGLSPAETQQRMENWFTWHQQMENNGVTIKDGHALQGASRRVSGSQRTITDRASSEVKELIGGYYVVSAADLEEATKIAQGYPDYDLGGTVEIREIVVFE